MSYLHFYSVIQKRELKVSISSQYIPPKPVQTQSLVLFNQVKPARRQEYTRFVHEILSPALCSLVRDQACQARLLEPTVANDDGNYTYVLLVEPAYEESIIPSPRYAILFTVSASHGSILKPGATPLHLQMGVIY